MGDTKNGDTKSQNLELVKALLSLDGDEDDDIIGLLLEDTENAVNAYCRTEVLPRQLEGFVSVIAAKRYTALKNEGIKAVSEGERRLEYFEDCNDYLSGFENRLKPFVSKRVWLPSEVSKDENI